MLHDTPALGIYISFTRTNNPKKPTKTPKKNTTPPNKQQKKTKKPTHNNNKQTSNKQNPQNNNNKQTNKQKQTNPVAFQFGEKKSQPATTLIIIRDLNTCLKLVSSFILVF